MSLKLKAERQKKGLTQVQLSKMLNITERGYRFIEKGERKPSCDVIIKLQNIFNQTIDHLLEQSINSK